MTARPAGSVESFGGPDRDRNDDPPGKPGRARLRCIGLVLVDLIGIEPMTFPASRDALAFRRLDHLLNRTMRFPAF